MFECGCLRLLVKGAPEKHCYIKQIFDMGAKPADPVTQAEKKDAAASVPAPSIADSKGHRATRYTLSDVKRPME
jgi:hypothetical protein